VAGYSRREAIGGLVGLLAGFIASPPVAADGSDAASLALEHWLDDRPGSRRDDFDPDAAALRRLGALYLRSHPEERSLDRLSRLLTVDASDRGPSPLSAALARDWANHDVSLVDGWVLARTEARLCAVLHLAAGARA